METLWVNKKNLHKDFKKILKEKMINILVKYIKENWNANPIKL